jgi:hypothetical protein
MQPEYLNNLSENLATLVQHTEERAGIEITVVLDPKRSFDNPNEPEPMACEIDEYGARLLIGNSAYFPEASVFHELQHICRILLERVPRIVVCEGFEYWSPKLDAAMTQLDNNLEHLIIVPREIEIYPIRRAHWENSIQRMLNRLAGNELHSDDRVRFAMLAWVLVHHITPKQALQDSAGLVLRTLRIEDRAEQYLEAVSLAVASKEQLVRITFDYFALPTNAGCLEYLNSQNGTSSVMALTDVLAPLTRDPLNDID